MSKGFAELVKKNEADLEKELAEARLDLVKLSAQLSTGSAAKEVGKLHNLKRKVAQIRTIQRQRRKE